MGWEIEGTQRPTLKQSALLGEHIYRVNELTSTARAQAYTLCLLLGALVPRTGTSAILYTVDPAAHTHIHTHTHTHTHRGHVRWMDHKS